MPWKRPIPVLRRNCLAAAVLGLLLAAPATLRADDERRPAARVFLRVQVLSPTVERLMLAARGHRHLGDVWHMPEVSLQIPGKGWSAWVDLSEWPWHPKISRAGGLAEYCSAKLTLSAVKGDDKLSDGCELRVQLADAPDESAVVHDFTERSGSQTIGFLVPTPLRENAREFETGSQMAARHRAWAEQATGGKPIRLDRFDICTSIWGHYDPDLCRYEMETLRRLGFNVINAESGLEAGDAREAGFRLYHQQWIFEADPRHATKKWEDFARHRLAKNLEHEEGRWEFRDGVAHWVIGDEVRTLSLMGLDVGDLNAWFREYLEQRGVGAGDDAFFGRPVDELEYPAEDLQKNTLKRDHDLPTRRLHYHAAKFGQWWSARQLRHTTNLIHDTLPGSKTETLPTDHGFFNAWGPPNIGMSWRLLDYFELGRQRSVDQLAVEDWLGLNHMYGPDYTWTGAQSHAYLTAISRSAVSDHGVMIRNLITPSDDGYLRLKAYSALGQGSKSFFFWTYGPTYIATENYWSDLRSMYDGIAKLNRALERAEGVLREAQVVRDPVAVLYSVSHDLWHSDHPAAFVEKRLLWHALRHLGVQPDFLSEQDVEEGRLKDYKVLYVVDWCLTRAASAAIDRWVNGGGVAYLSAGAATRDEYYEPFVPPFAAGGWGSDAAGAVDRFVAERHRYNERSDLMGLRPLTEVEVGTGTAGAFKLPVLGCRLDLAPQGGHGGDVIATFADGKPAGAVFSRGKGTVVALGFCPMLAYGQLAKFKRTTLEERWPAEPRVLARLPLERAAAPLAARASEPVVETSLLRGPGGHVLVLSNYTYQPLRELHVELRITSQIGQAFSTEGSPVRTTPTPHGIRLTLPLEWTDMVVIPSR